MQPDSVSTRDDADSARATDAHNAREAARADAGLQLDVALRDATGTQRLARQSALRKLLAPGEFETLREAVAKFVLVSRSEHASPERALIQLKERLALSARALGREPRDAVRAVVFDAFLCSYYSEVPLDDGV